MSERVGKIANKLLEVVGEVKDLKEYIRGYHDEISRQVFNLTNIQSAMIEILDFLYPKADFQLMVAGDEKVESMKFSEQLFKLLEQRQKDWQAEQDRLSAEKLLKEEQRIEEAEKLRAAMAAEEEDAWKNN